MHDDTPNIKLLFGKIKHYAQIKTSKHKRLKLELHIYATNYSSTFDFSDEILIWFGFIMNDPQKKLKLDLHNYLLSREHSYKRVWAGGTIEFLGDMTGGDYVESTTSITSVNIKESRKGRILLVEFGTSHKIGFKIVLQEKRTFAYTIDSRVPQLRSVRAPQRNNLGIRLSVPESTIKIFNSMTVADNRLHTDRDYCLAATGRSALVVHAPLLAALIAMKVISSSDRRRIQALSYRGFEPFHENETGRIVLKNTQHAMSSTLIGDDGRKVMSVEILAR